jgi:hypothetical protein
LLVNLAARQKIRDIRQELLQCVFRVKRLLRQPYNSAVVVHRENA